MIIRSGRTDALHCASILLGQIEYKCKVELAAAYNKLLVVELLQNFLGSI